MRRRAVYIAMLVAFVLVGLGDLLCTRYLFGKYGERVYERNPFANAYLTAYGWAGMIAFKGFTMAVVAAAAVLIARHRPRTGAALLAISCAIVMGVVIYSFRLSAQLAQVPADGEFELTPEVEVQSNRIAQRRRESSRFSETLAQVRTDIQARRLTLADAVLVMAQTDQAQSESFRAVLHRLFPNRTDEECLAAQIIQSVLTRLEEDPAEAQRVSKELCEEYLHLYGSNAPREVATPWDNLPTQR